jgi:GTP cyclohydrolase II
VITGQTVLKTAFGHFRVVVHCADDSAKRCVSISQGDLGTPGVVVRIHSSCLFGEALFATDCDCGAQLSSALAEIARRGSGVIVYLYQEGRGAGLDVKCQAMEYQRLRGVNSYEAYEALGLPRDLREYGAVGIALGDLGVAREVTALFNNPIKREALEQLGYAVVDHLVVPYEVSVQARDYLEMKRDIGAHDLDLSKIRFVP